MNHILASAFCVHDDNWFLHESLASFEAAGPTYVFVSRKAWDGTDGDWRKSSEIARKAGATVIEGEWLSEADHRAAALARLKADGFHWALIPDGDEIIEPGLLKQLLRIAESDLADRVFVHWDTYWKTAEHVIRPRERFTPLILLHIDRTHHMSGRLFGGGRPLLLAPDYGLIHHLSYAGPDERISRKIKTWGHRDEVVPGWWDQVWKAWDANPFLTSLHPTHPEAYVRAERIHPPEILQNLAPKGTPPAKSILTRWPKVSVVVPLHGQREAFRACLESLARCDELIHEIVVVDNASPDKAGDEIKGHPKALLLKNKKNEGFAAACNQGAAKATGELLLFLNSDTVLPRDGLIKLIEALATSPTIGATGPYSNHAGHHQQTDTLYSSPDQIDLFAQDFATFGGRDREVDMLVGFCLAIRKSTFEEVGGFDASFGLGTFEDNDLCYRLRRSGYRLILAGKSFVHHEGSLTLRQVVPKPNELLEANHQRFLDKWMEDIECGYSTGLSGLTSGPIQFHPDRKPDDAHGKAKPRISLCMIVKDEQRVLADCLKSATPYFDEVIVVDTGSTDRTREIAKEHGARVFEIPWPDSFALARNESLRHATGDWIFWMDADDTLPAATGRAVRRVAQHAPADLHGFIVPVQFVEDGPGAGTRVDHVKLVRNLPGLEFEGRIHEQILPSLRKHGGEIARLDAIVLHSGYDSSPEGQAKKSERDWTLLRLEYKERGDHPFVLFNIGMTRHYGGRHDDAIRWLRRCLRFSKSKESHVRKVYAMMAVSHRDLGNIEKALGVLEEGLNAFPGDPELHFHSGMVCMQMERFPEAENHYLACLKSDISGHFSSVDIGILGYKAYANLAGVALAQKQTDRAFGYWKEGLKAAPEVLSLAFACFDIALETMDQSVAQDMMEHVRNQEGPSENWAKMLERYAGRVSGEEHALSELKRAAGAFPNEPGPRLVYARKLLAKEQVGPAIPILQWLDERGIAEAAYCLGIVEVRNGSYQNALRYLSRANQLNPHHEETRVQLEGLNRALASGQDI